MTDVVCWDYIGIMETEKTMETTIYSILGSYRDNGKENGNYYTSCWGHIGIMEKKAETTT